MTCERCARVLHTGEARVLVGFTVKELAGIARDTLDLDTRERILHAIGLIDPYYEVDLRRELE